MTIKQLVEKYKSNWDSYIKSSYNETLLRSDFLDPFFELLGWDIKNNAGKSTNEREVILEEPLRAGVSENSKKPDYTFRLFSERKFFTEAKKPSVQIHTNDEAAKQVRRYGFTAKLKVSVLSNFEYLLIYDTSIKVDSTDNYQKALIKKYHYTEYEEKFEEIKQSLGKEAVYTGAFDAVWAAIEVQINQYSIDDLFLQQINDWRNILGQQIFDHDSAIDEQKLNDIVQSYLNRILFLRVCEDRNLETYQTLLNYANTSDFNALLNKFKQADRKYNSGLFDQLLSDNVVENISSVFWTIIKQLYYPESSYSFAVFSSDILGRIYEIFLSERLVIQGGSVVLVPKPEHEDRDIITTPTFIINAILRETVAPICQNKSFDEIRQLKFADIACGSGAFLLELVQLLNDIIIDYFVQTDASRLIQTNINTYKLPFEIKKELLLSCVYGIDKDFNAVEATKFGLLLKLLEDEDNNSITANSQILPNLENNIFFGNSLLAPSQVTATTRRAINPFDFRNLRFNAIVGNPPYMMSEDMKNFTPLELPLYKAIYLSAYKQFDKYFLFIERGLQLLTNDGFLGFIVPSKFAKVGAGKKLREHLTDNGFLHSMTSFGANQVFSDKTTYTCLLILGVQPQTTFKYTEVKSLRSWIVREPTSLNYEIEKIEDLDNDVWVLVSPQLKGAYQSIISQSVKLVDLVGEENIFNGIQTSANNIYIFTPINEDTSYYYFNKDGRQYKIEKDFTKPYFKTSSGIDNLNTYRPFKPNARVVYPYINTTHGAELLPLNVIQRDYPFAYVYLKDYEDKLNDPKRDIQPKPRTNEEWHRYGRHQSLDSCGLPQKIIVGVLSQGDKYAIDFNGTLISSGGTAGYCVVAIPPDSEYSIYYVQALLNSKYIEWFSALYGEVFRGGFIARGTKVLKNLPMRVINFTNNSEKTLHDSIAAVQSELIELQGRIDTNVGNRRELTHLNSEFSEKKRRLNELLAQLYNLETNDSLIPLIKDLYATN